MGKDIFPLALAGKRLKTDLAPSARHKHLLEPFQSAAGIFLIFLRSQAQRFAPSPWAREFF